MQVLEAGQINYEKHDNTEEETDRQTDEVVLLMPQDDDNAVHEL